MKIPLQRLDADLPVPAHAHAGDGGVDLFARHDTRIAPGEWAMVPTGVAVAVPEGHAGLVAPRSGLAARHGLGVVNGPGVVDSGYRGELTVILINHGGSDIHLERGERIAQSRCGIAPNNTVGYRCLIRRKTLDSPSIDDGMISKKSTSS